MKAKLLLFFFLFVISICSFAKSMDRQPIKIERKEPMDRSGMIRFFAYLDDSSLSINSLNSIDKLNISVVNGTTGEVVYSETYVGFDATTIDISMLEDGDYQILLTLHSMIYLGNFSINN